MQETINPPSKIENSHLPTLAQLMAVNKPNALDGSTGLNRETHYACQIRASNDYEAVQCWLNEYRASTETYRSYQREAERLLLWCIYQRKKPLSSLDRDDFELYFEFLPNPQPASFWCAPKGGRGRVRGSPSWRPFVKGLNQSAITTAITIIDSLLSYLVSAHYLHFNPLSLRRKRAHQHMNMAVQAMNSTRRVLEPDEWYAFLDTIEEMPENTPHERDEKVRTRFIIFILYFLCLRVHELVKHPWNSFIQLYNLWWFCLIGKGNKLALIPVHDELLTAIQHFRTYFKKSPLPKPNEESPIIPSWRSPNALGARQINKIIKNIAFKTAEKFADEPEKVERIKRVSSHWMRHQASSNLSSLNINIEKIGDILRHQNTQTTKGYIHHFYVELHQTMQKQALRMPLMQRLTVTTEELLKELIEKVSLLVNS